MSLINMNFLSFNPDDITVEVLVAALQANGFNDHAVKEIKTFVELHDKRQSEKNHPLSFELLLADIGGINSVRFNDVRDQTREFRITFNTIINKEIDAEKGVEKYKEKIIHSVLKYIEQEGLCKNEKFSAQNSPLAYFSTPLTPDKNSPLSMLIDTLYDDEAALLSNYGSVFVEYDQDTQQTDAFFAAVSETEAEKHIQFAFDNICYSLSLLEQITQTHGPVDIIKFNQLIKSDELRDKNQFYYTSEIESSKPLDQVLLNHFGTKRLFDLANTTFGAGWETSLIQHPYNLKYKLISKEQLEILKKQDIAPKDIKEIFETICLFQINRVKNLQIPNMNIWNN